MLAAFPTAVILRPSVIFGTEDGFFNRFAAMTRMGPILPVVGADTRFQPVYVDDVAQAAVKAVIGQAAPGVYELGGPEVDTFRGLMQRMLKVIQRRRAVVNVPFLVARHHGLRVRHAPGRDTGPDREQDDHPRPGAKACSATMWCRPGARGLADLGITPTAMEAVLPEYLWRYPPLGPVCGDQGFGEEPEEGLRLDTTLTAALLGLARGADRVSAGFLDRPPAAGRAFPWVSIQGPDLRGGDPAGRDPGAVLGLCGDGAAQAGSAGAA